MDDATTPTVIGTTSCAFQFTMRMGPPTFQRETAEERFLRRDWPEALKAAAISRWAGMRSGECSLYQAMAVLDALIKRGVRDPESVTKEHLQALVSEWARSKLSSATINKRLSCLSALGVNLRGWGCYRRHSKQLKWWLKPALLAPIGDLLNDPDRCPDISPRVRAELWKYICWTTRTGLRVEENLRLRRSDFSANFDAVTVPGTKTLMAQMTLPLSREAAQMAAAAFSGDDAVAQADPLMFNVTYVELARAWTKAKKHLDITDKLATLKSFRRTAARFLTIEKGMPLDVLRQYLRHENIKTTEGYLRLTGGYSEAEMRRWLG